MNNIEITSDPMESNQSEIKSNELQIVIDRSLKFKLENDLGYRLSHPQIYLYKISVINDDGVEMSYIGQTNNIDHRMDQYTSGYRAQYDQYPIDRAVSKYGPSKMKFEWIASAQNREMANEIEILLIQQYQSKGGKSGYNVSDGGAAFNSNPEIRQKISDGLNKFYANNVSIRKGVPLSDYHKEAISKASLGKAGTNLGKKFTEEHKAKIASANTGKIATQETIKKLSESHLGYQPANAKLTYEKAEQIRAEKLAGAKFNELCKKYGITSPTLNSLLKRNTYKNPPTKIVTKKA